MLNEVKQVPELPALIKGSSADTCFQRNFDQTIIEVNYFTIQKGIICHASTTATIACHLSGEV